MSDSVLRERFAENATGIAATVVTGTWLAAMLLDVEWWLPFMLFGYIVIVPVVAMLFEDDEDGAERSGDVAREEARARVGTGDADASETGVQNALDRLRTRYAEGDLTDEQFERKLDRLLATETPEDAAEYVARERAPERDAEYEQ